MAWIKNGELLKRATQEKFHIIVSADQQIKYQQNLELFEINVVVLKLIKNNFTNQLQKINELMSIAKEVFNNNNRNSYFEI